MTNFSFIESFEFKHHELLWPYFLSVTSDLRVHDPGLGEKNVKVVFHFSILSRYFTNHLLENIHIWAISIMLSWLLLGRLDTFPKVGLEYNI